MKKKREEDEYDEDEEDEEELRGGGNNSVSFQRAQTAEAWLLNKRRGLKNPVV